MLPSAGEGHPARNPPPGMRTAAQIRSIGVARGAWAPGGVKRLSSRAHPKWLADASALGNAAQPHDQGPRQMLTL
jgi:hypothetical protein